jgi:type VI secretion system protein ImpA
LQSEGGNRWCTLFFHLKVPMLGTTDDPALTPPLDAWLLPVDDAAACGPDLEHDPDFLELERSAAGKPESQFGPGSPPDWGRVRELAESLFVRTRDLRLALMWGRARLNLDGFSGLAPTLALIAGLLERFWDDLHPKVEADESDALARLSVIGSLDKLDGLLGDTRASRLSNDRELQGLRVRDVEIALGKLTPRTGEAARTQGEIAGMVAVAGEVPALLRAETEAAQAALGRIQALMVERFSAHLVVDLTTLRTMLTSVMAVLPIAVEAPAAEGVEAVVGQSSGSPSRQASGVYSVETRQEAVRAIELVCAYLERSEPTNPAQLLLRRAARVIDKNFLELMRELAPDAVKDVARILGVDPSTLNDPN